MQIYGKIINSNIYAQVINNIPDMIKFQKLALYFFWGEVKKGLQPSITLFHINYTVFFYC